MRIGLFTDSYFPGIDGVTYTIALWREKLKACGHEVTVVYPDGDHEPTQGELPVKSVPNPWYESYPVPLCRRPSSLPALDLVHCHGPGPVGFLGRYYAHQLGVPSVYTHHTPLEAYIDQVIGVEAVGTQLRRLYPRLETKFLQQFDVVTASTPHIDRDVDHLSIPVGIDMAFFQPKDDSLSAEPVIGYCGRLSDEKNVGELLRAARRRPAYSFRIVGEGPMRCRLEGQAPDNVELVDFLPREQLPRFYSALDVFLTASTADTLGLATLEANACGTPVVTPDVPPFTETIGAENGERFEYGSRGSLVEAIDHCLESSYNTRAAVSEYRIDRTIDRLTTVYENLCHGDEVIASTPADTSESD